MDSGCLFKSYMVYAVSIGDSLIVLLEKIMELVSYTDRFTHLVNNRVSNNKLVADNTIEGPACQSN